MPMSTPLSVRRVRSTYEFMKAQRGQYSVQALCRVLDVAPSGYYAWLQQPLSNRAQEDARLLRLIRAAFNASHGIYGAPRVFLDLREAGETCSKHRVARLMRENHWDQRHGPGAVYLWVSIDRGSLHAHVVASHCRERDGRMHDVP